MVRVRLIRRVVAGREIALGDTANPDTNGLWLLDVLAGTNVSGQNGALVQVASGDSIGLTAGATYRVNRALGVPLKALGNTEAITIRTMGALPGETIRIDPLTHGTALAKVTNKYAYASVFVAEIGAKNWRLIGLDITTEPPAGQEQGNQTVIDLGNVDAATGNYWTADERVAAQGFVLDRCFIHAPEATISAPGNDTVYTKTQMGIQAECGVTIKNCYIAGFAPRDFYTAAVNNSYAVLCISGSGPLVIENNYLEAGFAPLFLGGGTSPPEYTATITAATTTTVSVSDVTGLEIGAYVGLEMGFGVPGAYPPTFHWATGEVTDIDGLDVTFVAHEHVGGSAEAPVVGSTVYFRTSASATSSTTVSASPTPSTTAVTVADASAIAIGTKILTVTSGDSRCVYEVTDKTGNALTIDFIERGLHLMFEPPLVGGEARWVTASNPRIFPRNLTFRGNRVQNRLAWAAQAGQYMKGFFEIKCCDTALIEGNYFYCYPYDVNGDGSAYYGAPLAFPTYSGGGDPWVAIKNVTFRYNWVVGGRGADVGATLIFQGSDPYNVTDGNSRNYVVAHNVFEPHPSQVVGLGILAHAGASVGIDNLTFQHNTCINTGSFASNWSAGPGTSVTIKDNVLGVGSYGLNCQLSPYTVATCYPSGDLTFNLLVDTESVYPSANYWPSDANTHEVATWAGVGFEDSDAQDYRLTVSSPGYQAASDATDMGADFSLIYAAMNDWPVAWTP